MDEDLERLSGRRTRRGWLIALGTVPVLAAIAFGVWFFLQKKQEAENRALVDQVTGAAFGCVASVRGDAPEGWSLERALEHMSRMERLTRDREDPTIREERERFARLAADAAAGCEQLGTLMRQAQRDSAGLYFAVPASLAQPPDQSDPERWYRRTLPDSRPEAVELSRQIRVMAETVNARRGEYTLMAQELPVAGRGPSELARLIPLASLPRDRENPSTEVWPTPDAIVVLRRGSIPAVPCDTRYVNRASCYAEFLQRVTWDGEAGPQVALERPASVLYWSAFAPTFDGALWAVGVNTSNGGVVGRYAPDATRPELAMIEATVDATANIVSVTGGVAVFPSDGSAWMADDGPGMAFRQVETTPPPLVLKTSTGGASRGLSNDALGSLSITGSTEDGFVSRLSPADGAEDVLLNVIDSHSRVRAIADLRALRSGRSVALLTRAEESPDAIAITPDFGRTWLPASSD
ncbi:MAG: hypothetical protein H6719_32795 [Sandaracinaceae bacterium]|nr:hypothetical protein [Sandaracinaceae bacterium]